MKCPKCRRKEKVKNGFIRGEQRYKCKFCGYNYTRGQRGCPDYIELQAIKYHIEGNGFRRIERLMNISRVSVVSCVKQ